MHPVPLIVAAMGLSLFSSRAAAQDIVGGAPTDAHPAVGSIAVETGRERVSFCSGSLVRARWVVSAAHCAEAVHRYQLAGAEVVFVLGTETDGPGTEAVAPIRSVTAHPAFRRSHADIAVVELGGAGLPGAATVSLNDDAYAPDWRGSWITYVGFGTTGASGVGSGTKREVDVQVYGTADDMVVTWDGGGKSNVCQGDSGGAALRRDPTTGGLELVGVTAIVFNLDRSVADCEGEQAAAGATRVDLYLDWVLDHVDADGAAEPSDDSPGPDTGSAGRGGSGGHDKGGCAVGSLGGGGGGLALSGALVWWRRRGSGGR